MNQLNMKSIQKLVILTILFIWGLFNISIVLEYVFLFLEMLNPFIVGGGVAFVINILMKRIEDAWIVKVKFLKKVKRPISFLLTIIVLFLILALVVNLILPRFVETGENLAVQIPPFLNEAWKEIERLVSGNPELLEFLQNYDFTSFDWNSILTSAADFLTSGLGSVFTSTVVVASTVFGSVFNGIVSFIFAIYILMQKEVLKAQFNKLFTAYLPEKKRKTFYRVSAMLYKNFTSFFTYQCLEAVIIGTLFVVSMSLLGFQDAVVIGVLIGALALIPIVGAFIGCGVGAFIILVDDPIRALWFVVLFLVIQQIEGNVIYPRVVGSSVGLPAIWVLVAVSLGGSLMGILGMIICIPITSTLYTLLREHVNMKLEKKIEVIDGEEATEAAKTTKDRE